MQKLKFMQKLTFVICRVSAKHFAGKLTYAQLSTCKICKNLQHTDDVTHSVEGKINANDAHVYQQ